MGIVSWRVFISRLYINGGSEYFFRSRCFVAAFPHLYHFKVLIACLLVLFILMMNLRGLTESATVLSYPVYLFIIGLIVLIAVGTFRVATGQIAPHIHSTVGVLCQVLRYFYF